MRRAVQGLSRSRSCPVTGAAALVSLAMQGRPDRNARCSFQPGLAPPLRGGSASSPAPAALIPRSVGLDKVRCGATAPIIFCETSTPAQPAGVIPMPLEIIGSTFFTLSRCGELASLAAIQTLRPDMQCDADLPVDPACASTNRLFERIVGRRLHQGTARGMSTPRWQLPGSAPQ